MRKKEPVTKESVARWFNLRGDKETLANVRRDVLAIKGLIPKAKRMYIDVPEDTKSIKVVEAAVSLYLELLKEAVSEIESSPKRSLKHWVK